jgi:uncharacterized membrane protein
MPAGLLALFVLLVVLVLIPLLLADAMVSALLHLGIAPWVAPLLVIGIFVGSLFNIPVYRRRSAEVLEYRPYDLFGIDRVMPRLVRENPEQVIALNLGGCVIPSLIVAYELLRLGLLGGGLLLAAVLAAALNSIICFLLARPVAGLGILLPALVPGCMAALMAMVLAPGHAAAVAFCAGVLGPLIGADLMHLRGLSRRGVGLLSIGGAGTFDGIVISGFLAALLGA